MNVDQPGQQDHLDLQAHLVHEVQQVQQDLQAALATWDRQADQVQAAREDPLEKLVSVVLRAHLVLLALPGQRASVVIAAFREGREPQEALGDRDQLDPKDHRASQGKMDAQGIEVKWSMSKGII